VCAEPLLFFFSSFLLSFVLFFLLSSILLFFFSSILSILSILLFFYSSMLLLYRQVDDRLASVARHQTRRRIDTRLQLRHRIPGRVSSCRLPVRPPQLPRLLSLLHGRHRIHGRDSPRPPGTAPNGKETRRRYLHVYTFIRLYVYTSTRLLVYSSLHVYLPSLCLLFPPRR
jgi:hypothetical protein